MTLMMMMSWSGGGLGGRVEWGLGKDLRSPRPCGYVRKPSETPGTSEKPLPGGGVATRGGMASPTLAVGGCSESGGRGWWRAERRGRLRAR